MLTREQIAQVVNDKHTMYDAMVKNGWALPHRKQPICSLDFMVKVRAHQLWCPRQDQTIKTVVCPTPPPKKELAEFIRNAANNIIAANANTQEELIALEATVELIEKKLADLPWLIIVLHVLDEKHAIFGKDYFYTRPARITTLQTLPSISNEDGFFDGLPIR